MEFSKLYRLRHKSIIVFLLSIIFVVISNKLLLESFHVTDYPGQNKLNAHSSQSFNFIIEVLHGVLHFLILSFVIFLTTVKNFYSSKDVFLKIYNGLLLLFFLSPLMIFFEIFELLVFILMREYFEIQEKITIGVMMMAILVLYHALLYFLSTRIYPYKVHKTKALMYFPFYLTAIGFVDFLV